MLAMGVISRDYRKSGTFPEWRASAQNPDEPLAYISRLSKQPQMIVRGGRKTTDII